MGTLQPVTAERIAVAQAAGLTNVIEAAVACRLAGLPFFAACALLEKESGGANVYGHDAGTPFSTTALGRPANGRVTASNFQQFLSQVCFHGRPSNGVGPCQITYAGALKGGLRDGGFFRQMMDRGLLPWVPADNMLFGFEQLAGYAGASLDWHAAGKLYNGAEAYGADLAAKVLAWKKRLHI